MGHQRLPLSSRVLSVRLRCRGLSPSLSVEECGVTFHGLTVVLGWEPPQLRWFPVSNFYPFSVNESPFIPPITVFCPWFHGGWTFGGYLLGALERY